jgi:hypothetical protein
MPRRSELAGLLVGADGTIWAAVERELHALAPAAEATWQAAPLGDVGALRALGTGASGALLLAADAGLYQRSSGGSWTRLPADPAVDVAALTAASDGTLWIGSPAGRTLAVPAGAPSASLTHAPVFTGLDAGPADVVEPAAAATSAAAATPPEPLPVTVVTLDQGGLPPAVVQAFSDAGSPLETPSAVVTKAAGRSWTVRCGTALYVVTARRDGTRWVLAGFKPSSVASPTGTAVRAAGVDAWPVTLDGVPGTLRVRTALTTQLPAAKDGPSFADTSPLKAVSPAAVAAAPAGTTPIALQDALGHVYDPTTVTVHLNAVSAKQGVPVTPVLGSGDPTAAHQQFTTPSPVAVVAGPPGHDGAPTATSTLEVRVDSAAWTPVTDLLSHPPGAQVYTTHANADGSVVVQFGDGVHGARLPAGASNVVARYLQGGGPGGAAPGGALVQPLDRPQMVRGVHNPVPAKVPPTAPEDTARDAAVRVLDRVVTLADVEDVALAQVGVATASVALLTGPHGRTVAISVATTKDAPDTTLDTVGLAMAARSGGDLPPVAVVAATLVPVTLKLEVLSTEPAAGVAKAVAAALANLRADQPGKPLLASSVLATATAVGGVDAAHVLGWSRSGTAAGTAASLAATSARLRPPGATTVAGAAPVGAVVPAELLVLDPAVPPGIVVRAPAGAPA